MKKGSARKAIEEMEAIDGVFSAGKSVREIHIILKKEISDRKEKGRPVNLGLKFLSDKMLKERSKEFLNLHKAESLIKILKKV
jgi:hypothetical protein